LPILAPILARPVTTCKAGIFRVPTGFDLPIRDPSLLLSSPPRPWGGEAEALAGKIQDHRVIIGCSESIKLTNSKRFGNEVMNEMINPPPVASSSRTVQTDPDAALGKIGVAV
jgi:hypothetical protein